MSGIQMRGYVLLSAAAYLRKSANDKGKPQILDELSPQVQQSLNTATQASWHPASHLAELYQALAALCNGDEERARVELIECGKYAAREASNTFLRLLMKLLTPAMFAKKLPEIWGRDATGGKIVTQVFDDHLVNRLIDMEIDHIAPICVGYVTFALEAMGKSITGSKVHGWSLAKPSSPDCSFEVFWRTT